MLEIKEKLEKKLVLYCIGINYLDEIKEREEKGIAMEPFYVFKEEGNLIKILRGFDEKGFNPENNELKDYILSIVKKIRDFPVNKLNKMGIDLISYDKPNQMSSKDSKHFTFKEFKKIGKPEEIINITKIKRTYKKIR